MVRILLAVSMLAGCGARGAARRPCFRVVRVVDGDTFDAVCNCEMRFRVRFKTWNAPEAKEPGGPAATARLKALIEGKRVNIKYHKRGKWGRVIGTVTLPDGRDVGKVMRGGTEATSRR